MESQGLEVPIGTLYDFGVRERREHRIIPSVTFQVHYPQADLKVYWGNIGIMENQMETAIVYRGFIGIMERKWKLP